MRFVSLFILSPHKLIAHKSLKLTNLQQILNLTSQNDTLSHEVAIDSKLIALASQRDSSSMKSLVVVTMVFLPGTFVSTLLSMPLMGWKPPFVMYWTITAPLTIMTLLVWGAWIMVQRRRQKHENDVAEANIDDRRSLSEVGMLLEKKKRVASDSGNFHPVKSLLDELRFMESQHKSLNEA
jgi:hypothetical protein